MDNIGELTAVADRDGRRLEFILAVPARRYAELAETFQGLAFDADGIAEAAFAGHRLIVAHDPLRAEEQSDRRRARIRELEEMGERLAGKLDQQDAGQTARGRRASDRGSYSRFTRAVAEAELTRFIKPDLQADLFNWTVDEAAIAQAELFDGKLALLTNVAGLTPAEAVARYKSLADIERVRRGARTRGAPRLTPRPEIRHRDRPRPPSPAGPDPGPCADLLSRPGSLPRDADAAEGEGPFRQPAHGARPSRAHPEAHDAYRRPDLHRPIEEHARTARSI